MQLPVLTYDAIGGEGDGEDDSLGAHYADTPPTSYKKLLPPGVLHPGMPDVRAVKPAVTLSETIDIDPTKVAHGAAQIAKKGIKFIFQLSSHI
jgi:hypothetical protein